MHMKCCLAQEQTGQSGKGKTIPQREAIYLRHQKVQKEMPDQLDYWPELDKLPKPT